MDEPRAAILPQTQTTLSTLLPLLDYISQLPMLLPVPALLWLPSAIFFSKRHLTAIGILQDRVALGGLASLSPAQQVSRGIAPALVVGAQAGEGEGLVPDVNVSHLTFEP
ncbi:hypothetical protein AALO_G00295570 [Alosa alosa]|uniref:Uncharacterized protein n=1 Tax=Alosa alosa TaxID=278164 RepID=A0AAV6FD67_9TELE|nr:hypothetical protein AALO_G00295570 [Alosa alosa]